jgi:hypothetical protein
MLPLVSAEGMPSKEMHRERHAQNVRVASISTEHQRSLGLVHTFRFSTGRQVTIIAGQSSGTQESIGKLGYQRPAC